MAQPSAPNQSRPQPQPQPLSLATKLQLDPPPPSQQHHHRQDLPEQQQQQQQQQHYPSNHQPLPQGQSHSLTQIDENDANTGTERNKRNGDDRELQIANGAGRLFGGVDEGATTKSNARTSNQSGYLASTTITTANNYTTGLTTTGWNGTQEYSDNKSLLTSPSMSNTQAPPPGPPRQSVSYPSPTSYPPAGMPPGAQYAYPPQAVPPTDPYRPTPTALPSMRTLEHVPSQQQHAMPLGHHMPGPMTSAPAPMGYYGVPAPHPYGMHPDSNALRFMQSLGPDPRIALSGGRHKKVPLHTRCRLPQNNVCCRSTDCGILIGMLTGDQTTNENRLLNVPQAQDKGASFFKPFLYRRSLLLDADVLCAFGQGGSRQTGDRRIGLHLKRPVRGVDLTGCCLVSVASGRLTLDA